MISSPGSVASITKRQLAPGRIGQPFVEPKASIHLSTWNGRSLQRKNYSICILYQSCPCKSTIPGPSNRSPPATFKSPKATISETCWRVLVHVLKHVYIARGDLRGHRFRKRDNVVCQVPDGQVETEAGAPWGDGGKRTRHAPLTLISILVVRLFPRFINQPTNRTLYGK